MTRYKAEGWWKEPAPGGCLYVRGISTYPYRARRWFLHHGALPHLASLVERKADREYYRTEGLLGDVFRFPHVYQRPLRVAPLPQ